MKKRSLFTLACLVVSVTLLMSPMGIVVNTALSEPAKVKGGIWLFDEGEGTTVQDSSGNANHGKTQNTKWVEGIEGRALYFYDYGQATLDDPKMTIQKAAKMHAFVKIPHSDTLTPQKTVDISAAIYIDIDFPQYFGTIVEKGQGYGAAYRLLLATRPRRGEGIIEREMRLRGVVGMDIGYAGGRESFQAAVTGSTRLERGKWYRVRMTYDGETLRLFVDGKEDGSVKKKVKTMANREPVIIGERFTGRIDEVKISLDAPLEGQK